MVGEIDLAYVKLVPHDLSYAERIFELISVPQVKDALGIKDESVEDTIRFIHWIIEEEHTGNQVSRIILNEHKELVGITTLMFIKPVEKQCHIGTWIGQKYWGRGYNQASKLEILKIAFLELGMKFVFAGARKINIRSQKAQEKLSFIRLNVETLFPKELEFLEKREKQSCVLHAFYKEDFINYLNIT
ncbi:N-acetyltransferase [Paenibacillus albidus]|uniref:N-acetyltransferase n=1 Tax=Paenibacillus albidus TaxID=2041023 RepID=A0A917CJH7_9BACL|nr:N-acetyltransferase [Paenibacillus albidus]